MALTYLVNLDSLACGLGLRINGSVDTRWTHRRTHTEGDARGLIGAGALGCWLLTRHEPLA